MRDPIRAEFLVTGLVQGVGFRYFVYRHATSLGLKGYARNIYDGSVETVVEGENSAVQELHKLLRQGPSHSHVSYVKAEYKEYTGKFGSFDIR